jgi:hypothetical protein
MFGAIAVVINIEADVPPELSGAAVQSCEVALGEGQCRLIDSDAQPEPAADWSAAVRYGSGRDDTVLVALRSNRTGTLLQVRELSFGSHDEPRDRWESIGVLIAALVASREKREPFDATVAEVAAEPQWEPASASRPPALRLDAAFLMSRAADRGAPHLGPEVRGSLELASLPLFVLASASYGVRASEEPDVSWLSGAVGVGVRIGRRAAPLTAEIHTSGAIERWALSASESQRSDKDSVTRFGPRLGVDVVWATADRVHLFVGGRLAMLRPEIRIDVRGENVEQLSPMMGSLLVGFRFRP